MNYIMKIKGSDGNPSNFVLPILNKIGEQIGYLRLIDGKAASEPEVVEKLTKWRRMFMRYFLTQFLPSVERTTNWLESVVLPSNDRVMFLICDVEGKLIGNFGLCNISTKQVELDNLIRGEKGGDANLILHSELTLLNWVFKDLDIPLAFLHVFATNYKTIALHQTVGFIITEEIYLKKQSNGEELTFTKLSNAFEDSDIKYLKMELKREDFYNHHNQQYHQYGIYNEFRN